MDPPAVDVQAERYQVPWILQLRGNPPTILATKFHIPAEQKVAAQPCYAITRLLAPRWDNSICRFASIHDFANLSPRQNVYENQHASDCDYASLTLKMASGNYHTTGCAPLTKKQASGTKAWLDYALCCLQPLLISFVETAKWTRSAPLNYFLNACNREAVRTLATPRTRLMLL
eukprot:TRINITY_DN29017_c0_g2_i1.p2 TRINITY_DN29017_c0_g2~~TRINITY_DN29017_c0_g2_i1.p2  ORF type:complete len:174 (+),score=8.82 TRINITY_DN29017_c0_g2_i1:363-884(+)